MSYLPSGILAVDEELFEDNPIEYIRRDLEGSGKCKSSIKLNS